jgi:hypothetical protein
MSQNVLAHSPHAKHNEVFVFKHDMTISQKHITLKLSKRDVSNEISCALYWFPLDHHSLPKSSKPKATNLIYNPCPSNFIVLLLLGFFLTLLHLKCSSEKKKITTNNKKTNL